MRLHNEDRGAAAVEFALVLPILVLIICGIVDFGRAYNANLALTHAAREAARIWALGGTAAETSTAATTAAVGLTVTSVTTTTCAFGNPTTVTVTADFSFITPLIQNLSPGLSTLSSNGVMRCGG